MFVILYAGGCVQCEIILPPSEKKNSFCTSQKLHIVLLLFFFSCNFFQFLKFRTISYYCPIHIDTRTQANNQTNKHAPTPHYTSGTLQTRFCFSLSLVSRAPQAFFSFLSTRFELLYQYHFTILSLTTTINSYCFFLFFLSRCLFTTQSLQLSYQLCSASDDMAHVQIRTPVTMPPLSTASAPSVSISDPIPTGALVGANTTSVIVSSTPSPSTVPQPLTTLSTVSIAMPEQSVSIKPLSTNPQIPSISDKPIVIMPPALPSTSVASPTVQSPSRPDPSLNPSSSGSIPIPSPSIPVPASGTGSASTTTTASAPIMTAAPASSPNDPATVQNLQIPSNAASSSLAITPNFGSINIHSADPNDSPQPAVPFARMPPGSTLAAKAKRASDAVITPFTQRPEDDPLRKYYSERDPENPEDLSPRQLENLRQISWHRIPLTVQQASDSLDMAGFQRPDITSCLTVLNIKSHSILRIDIQRRILAVKLVQRQLCLFAIVQCRKNVDKQKPHLVTEQHRRIRSLPPTSVWRSPRIEGPLDEIPWSTGDVPVFDSLGNIIPGQPPLAPADPAAVQPSPRPRVSTRGRSRALKRGLRRSSRDDAKASLDNLSLEAVPTGTASRPRRLPPATRSPRNHSQIDDSEYCRLLHVLADDRAERARALLLISHEADPESFSEVAAIYNDRAYRPDRVPLVEDTVDSSDVASIRPENLKHSRSPRELADMFNEFRTKFASIIDSQMRAWLAGSSDKKAAMAYAFCQVHHCPNLKRIMLTSKSQVRARKRRRTSTDVITQVNGHEQSHEEELKSFALEEARLRMVAAILVAMREARGLATESNSDGDRKLCTDVIEHLSSRLRAQVSESRSP